MIPIVIFALAFIRAIQTVIRSIRGRGIGRWIGIDVLPDVKLVYPDPILVAAPAPGEIQAAIGAQCPIFSGPAAIPRDRVIGAGSEIVKGPNPDMIRSDIHIRPEFDIVQLGPPLGQAIAIGIVPAKRIIGLGIGDRAGQPVGRLAQIGKVLDEFSAVIEPIVGHQGLTILVFRGIEEVIEHIVFGDRSVDGIRTDMVRDYPGDALADIARSRHHFLVPILNFLGFPRPTPDAILIDKPIGEAAGHIGPTFPHIGHRQGHFGK